MKVQSLDLSGYDSREIEFAKALSKKMVDSNKIVGPLGEGNDVAVNVIAKFLLEECSAGKGHHQALASENMSEPISLEVDGGEAGLFPRNFTINLSVAKFDITIDNPSPGVYEAIVDSSIFGVSLGKSRIVFENGVFSRTETINVGLAKLSYSLSIDISNGFSVEFSGVASLNLVFDEKVINIGPYKFKLW